MMMKFWFLSKLIAPEGTARSRCVTDPVNTCASAFRLHQLAENAADKVGFAPCYVYPMAVAGLETVRSLN